MVLDGKVVLITGATGVVGSRLVEAFSKAGASLALGVRRTSDCLTMDGQLRDRTHPSMAVPCDLRAEDEVVRMVHRVVQRY
jgi:NAD(P)-dependent dehydrogenase (short-subunit alcohol dehydrogenase family)